MANKLIDVIKQYFKIAKNFDHNLRKVKLLSLDQGKCIAELKIEEEHTNSFGTLHGGFSSTLVDCLSTYALQSHEKSQDRPNVSVNINMKFLKAAHLGDEIIIESRTDRVGKSLAFCEVDILKKDTRELLVKGSHIKYFL